MSRHRSDAERAKRVGLLAAWGRYPIVVAEALLESGYEVVCLGVRDHADRETLEKICTHYHEIGFGSIGRAAKLFRRHGVDTAMMAGKFHKHILYQPRVWLRHLPDWGAIQAFYGHFITAKHDNKDDSLLGTLVGAFARRGVTFHPATDFAPELLVKPGQLTRKGLSTKLEADVQFGWELAKEMGRLDVGQTVVVKNRAVIAIEAIEGTDACIRRAGEICANGGFTVVKVAKPQQDMRFDVPTIGVGTLESIVAAGGRVLAIEAEKTILLDEPAVLEFANQKGLTIVALEEAQALRIAS